MGSDAQQEYWRGSRLHDSNIGGKLLLSALLKKHNGVQKDNDPSGWVQYQGNFRACDVFNADMRHVFWPYRVQHFERQLDEVNHVHIALNTLAAWREEQGGKEERIDKELMMELSKQLL